MPAERQPLGDRGERVAEAHLRKLGYTVVARNFRCPQGEIDLVAVDRGTIVFVEVKTRGGPAFGSPFEAVGRSKRRRLQRAAAVYLNRHRLHGRYARFDVIAVHWGPSGPACELLRNAFEAGE